MDLKKITDDVYACLQEDKGIGCSNSGLICHGGRSMVIDTFWDLPHTREMISLYESVWNSIPDRVVNTHVNGDHSFGNQLFADAEIIASQQCAEAFGKTEIPKLMQNLKNQVDADNSVIANFARSLADWDFSGIELRAPTIIFDEYLEVDIDGLTACLIHVGPAHTAGDIIVHIPEAGVIFAGDVVFRQCTPVGWEGTYKVWLDALDKIIELNPEIIVPGHGPLCGIEGARELKEYFKYVRQESKVHFEAGISVLEAAKKIDIKLYVSWTEPQRLLFNVERAYREFRGDPWDAPIDRVALFSGVNELYQHMKKQYD